MDIRSLPSNLTSPPGSGGAHESRKSGGESFAEAMTGYLRGVNSDLTNASRKMSDLVVRGEGTIHEAMIAMNDAEGSFRLLMEMRNRLVDGVNRLLTTQF